MTLTIAYLTSRREPMFWWFIASLREQCKELPFKIKLVIVDFWAQELPHHHWAAVDVDRRLAHFKGMSHDFRPIHVPPKPCVWQGPHRLTKNDYFAAATARNTALCHAEDGWIAYVDDVSVLLPTWLPSVIDAINGNYIACGAFKKVKNLVVENGLVKSFDPFPPGVDSRWNEGSPLQAVSCPPNWLFGCSCVIPVSGLEKINGWPEAVCDACGTGAEDCFVGMALDGTGHQLKYDRRMFTYESEERHFQHPQMTRVERGEIGKPNSMSHAAVRILQNCKRFDNNLEPFPDIAALRKHVLNGGAFPVPKNPKHLWYDGTPLSEL